MTSGLFLPKVLKRFFGLINEILGVGGAVIRDNDEEGFIHNIGFWRKKVDKVDVVVHEDTK